MGQPHHEQAELLDPGLPAAAGPRAPAQEQHDRVRIRLRRGLRAVATEPLMPQEPVGDLHHLKIRVQHRPVPLPGRQPHRERSHPPASLSKSIAVNDYQPRAQHPRRTTTPPARSPGSCDVLQQARVPPEKEGVFEIEPSQERLPAAVHVGSGRAGDRRPQPDRLRVAVAGQMVDPQPDQGTLDDRQLAVVIEPAAAVGQPRVQPIPAGRGCGAVAGGRGGRGVAVRARWPGCQGELRAVPGWAAGRAGGSGRRRQRAGPGQRGSGRAAPRAGRPARTPAG